MPSLAHAAGGLAAALAVALLFLLWIGWPGFLAVGAGAVFGVAFMVVATALGDDPRAADAAWRAQATDLAGDPAAERLGAAGEAGRQDAAADEPRP
jgi:hypothetical protein